MDYKYTNYFFEYRERVTLKKYILNLEDYISKYEDFVSKIYKLLNIDIYNLFDAPECNCFPNGGYISQYRHKHEYKCEFTDYYIKLLHYDNSIDYSYRILYSKFLDDRMLTVIKYKIDKFKNNISDVNKLDQNINYKYQSHTIKLNVLDNYTNYILKENEEQKKERIKKNIHKNLLKNKCLSILKEDISKFVDLKTEKDEKENRLRIKLKINIIKSKAKSCLRNLSENKNNLDKNINFINMIHFEENKYDDFIELLFSKNVKQIIIKEKESNVYTVSKLQEANYYLLETNNSIDNKTIQYDIIDNGYLYIIKEREFISLKSDVYKIGCTKDILRRVREYPKGSILKFCIYSKDYKKIEKLWIKNLLKNKDLTHKKEYGKEYFKGNINIIIDKLFQTLNNIN